MHAAHAFHAGTQVVQPDGSSVSLLLRAFDRQGWLHLAWHPVSARVSMGDPPDGSRSAVFTFGGQLQAQLRGLVLTGVSLPQAWERAAQLDFGQRPGEPPSLRLVVEVMGRYSNVVLASGDAGRILLCAYQVGGRQSRLRQLQVGGQYQPPPPAMGLPPSASETLEEWRDNVTGGALQVRGAAWRECWAFVDLAAQQQVYIYQYVISCCGCCCALAPSPPPC